MTTTAKPLQWRRSDNGHVQIADSALTRDDGMRLAWYLGGQDNHWTASLSGGTAGLRAENLTIEGSEDDAKAAAQQYEDHHAGTPLHFTTYEVVQRYWLVGGGCVDQVIGNPPAPLTLGELQAYYVEDAKKKLKKARSRGKTLRMFDDSGVALIPVANVAYVQVLQRDSDGHYFRGKPGWPEGGAQESAEDLLEHLMGMVESYGAMRADLVQAEHPQHQSVRKAADAMLEDVRAHLSGLLGADEDDEPE